MYRRNMIIYLEKKTSNDCLINWDDYSNDEIERIYQYVKEQPVEENYTIYNLMRVLQSRELGGDYVSITIINEIGHKKGISFL